MRVHELRDILNGYDPESPIVIDIAAAVFDENYPTTIYDIGDVTEEDGLVTLEVE